MKAARYTVTRPFQIGAALAGAGPELIAALGEFGDPLGDAFQLRDDVLGVFGDPAVTGKSVLDDLREGKPTVMMALARSAADRSQTAGCGSCSAIRRWTPTARRSCARSSRGPVPENGSSR